MRATIYHRHTILHYAIAVQFKRASYVPGASAYEYRNLNASYNAREIAYYAMGGFEAPDYIIS